jgi:UDPglucose 6-dehydrogenase
MFDPKAMNNEKGQLGGTILYSVNLYEALKDTDALIIATEWSEFRTPNFNKINSLLKNKIIFDVRNLFEIRTMKELGYYYESIGR